MAGEFLDYRVGMPAQSEVPRLRRYGPIVQYIETLTYCTVKARYSPTYLFRPFFICMRGPT